MWGQRWTDEFSAIARKLKQVGAGAHETASIWRPHTLAPFTAGVGESFFRPKATFPPGQPSVGVMPVVGDA